MSAFVFPLGILHSVVFLTFAILPHIKLAGMFHFCFGIFCLLLSSSNSPLPHLSFHLPGIPTYILLNTTGLFPPARADRLELLSITGGITKTLPIRYYPDRRPFGIWNITEFVPPNEAFFLRVTGYDQDGFLFQRVSSVSFSSIIPGQCPGFQ